MTDYTKKSDAEVIKAAKSHRKIYDDAEKELIDIKKELKKMRGASWSEQKRKEVRGYMKNIPDQHRPKPASGSTASKPKKRRRRKATRAAGKSSS